MIIKKDQLIESEIGDDLLVFDTSEQKFLAMNLTGRIIWKNFFTDEDVERITDALFTAFGKTSKMENIRADVAGFLSLLENHGLIVQDGGKKKDRSVERQHVQIIRLSGKTYEKPTMQEIPLDWLKKKHPSALLNVLFSDTWCPSSDALDP